MVKKLFFICIVIIPILISGCWDMIDIEDRAYVSGIAFDKPAQEEVERQRESLEYPEVYTPDYSVTYINPIPAAQTGDATGDETFSTRTTTAISPVIAERQMATRLNLDLFFGHTKLVLFGEDLLKDPEVVKEMMDYLHRNQQFNWNVYVGVVEGEAREAFDIKPTGVDHLVDYITGIMENEDMTDRVSNIDLNQMFARMGQKGTVVLPRVVVGEEDIKVEGAAHIRNFAFHDYLSGTEARGLRFLKGTLEGGMIMAKYQEIFVPYTIVNVETQTEVNVTEEGIEALYTIETEGQLDEGKFGMEFLDHQAITDIEERIADEIVVDCMKVIDEVQNFHEDDLIYLGEHIGKFHPRIWKEIEDDWDEIFAEIEIKVEADVSIRRVGVIK